MAVVLSTGLVAKKISWCHTNIVWLLSGDPVTSFSNTCDDIPLFWL